MMNQEIFPRLSGKIIEKSSERFSEIEQVKACLAGPFFPSLILDGLNYHFLHQGLAVII
jgi:hypothetical protein